MKTKSKILCIQTLIMLLLIPFSMKGQMAIATGSSNDMGIYNSYDVVEIQVDAIVKDQIAQVTVSQTIFNPNNRSLEVEIFFPLPDKGAVQDFILMVDGKEMPGELMEKAEAQRIYEGIVRSKRDPALMEYVGYGLFKTRVFPIGIREKRTITVSYSQVLERKLNTLSFSYPFGTQKFSSRTLETVRLHARIQSTEPIKTIYSPSDDILINRSSDHLVQIQMQKNYVIPDHDFRLTIGYNKGEVGATVLSYKPDASSDGYFMLMASPSLDDVQTKTVEKTVIFVLDKSGSMAGKKLEQSKNALKFVLNNLNEGDLFNIITYDNRAQSYKEGLEFYTSITHKNAIEYVNTIQSGGGTNIDEALEKALKVPEDHSRPTYVIFLTDGLPTVGETNEMQLAENCKKRNKANVRLFAFGVGYDVNARLLDRLSSQNGGISEYVKPDDNIEESVGKFYANISAPVLNNIAISFSNTRLSETYPKDIPDIFKGSQLVWIGRYSKAGKNTVTIRGKSGKDSKEYVFDVELAGHKSTNEHAYLTKIWATRKVGYLIDQIDLYGQNDEMINELVQLSKDYGILTPYTSFLAREDVDLNNMVVNERRTKEQLTQLEITSGKSGNAQRAVKKSLKESHSFADVSSALDDIGIEEEVTVNVRNVGNKTFYFRKNQWIESTLSDTEIANAKEIAQFSDEYFELSRGQKADFNQYLSFSEDVVVKIDEQVYYLKQ